METRRLGRTDLDISVLSIGGLYTSSLAGGVAETEIARLEPIDVPGGPIGMLGTIPDEALAVEMPLRSRLGARQLELAVHAGDMPGRRAELDHLQPR